MPDAHTMQCMEVWGGNQPVNRGVVMPGLDAWVFSEPHGRAEGGGDVHYVSSCATGRITRLLVADVSGHGQSVAGVADGLRSLMRRFVNYIDQTRFITALNEQFASLSAASGFATAVVSTYFAPTGALSICNAGHPPPLMFRARTGQWSLLELKARADAGLANTPLGIIDRVAYEQFSTKLAVGDMVLCYTDSLIECRDSGNRELGMAGLLRVVQELGSPAPDALVPALLADVKDRRGFDLGADDLTVLLFRVNELAPRLTLRERLRAPYLVLKGALASIREGRGESPWPEWSLANIGGAMLGFFNRFASRAKPD